MYSIQCSLTQRGLGALPCLPRKSHLYQCALNLRSFSIVTGSLVLMSPRYLTIIVRFVPMLQLILHSAANSSLTSLLHVSESGLGGSIAMRTHSAHVGLSTSGDHATRWGTLVLHSALALRSFEADGMRCIRLSDTELTSQRYPGGASGGKGETFGGTFEGGSNAFSWRALVEFPFSDFEVSMIGGGASCVAGAEDSNSSELESVLDDGSNTVIGVLRSVTTPFSDDFDVFLTDLLVSDLRRFSSDFKVS